MTAIVDIEGIGAELAQKWSRTVTGAIYGRPGEGQAMRADVTYDAERQALKIVIVGGARDASNLLALIEVWQEQLTA